MVTTSLSVMMTLVAVMMMTIRRMMTDLCLSARVMYQSKTAVSGNTYQAGMVSIWQGNIYFSTGIKWPFYLITR